MATGNAWTRKSPAITSFVKSGNNIDHTTTKSDKSNTSTCGKDDSNGAVQIATKKDLQRKSQHNRANSSENQSLDNGRNRNGHRKFKKGDRGSNQPHNSKNENNSDRGKGMTGSRHRQTFDKSSHKPRGVGKASARRQHNERHRNRQNGADKKERGKKNQNEKQRSGQIVRQAISKPKEVKPLHSGGAFSALESDSD